MKDLKFIKKELDQQSERYVRAMKVIEKKRRKAEEIKDDNIKDITQKFTETDIAEELRKFLTEIGRNIQGWKP